MSNLLRRVSLLGLSVALIVGHDSGAAAQGGRRPIVRRYQGATSEPTISPYLRLIQPGSDPGLNYFNLVQPQIANQNNMQLQARQIRGLNAQLRQDERQGPFGALTQIGATGGRGAATYRNYSHYYPGMGAGGGGGGPSRQYKSSSSGGGGFGFGGMGMGGGF